MILAKLIKDENWYTIDASSKEHFGTLAFWLKSVLPHKIDTWKNMIINLNEEVRIGGNATAFEKEGDTIIVDDMYYDDDEQLYQYAVHIKQDNLLEILDQWEMLCKQEPKEILIVRRDGKIALEGRN